MNCGRNSYFFLIFTVLNIMLAFLQRHEERVIIISSKGCDNAVSDAENALQQIATVILKVSGDFLVSADAL